MTLKETAAALARLRSLYPGGNYEAHEGVVEEWHRHLADYTADQVDEAITRTVATWKMTLMPPVAVVLENIADEKTEKPSPERILLAAIMKKGYDELREVDRQAFPEERYTVLVKNSPGEIEENGKVLMMWIQDEMNAVQEGVPR